MAFDYSELVDVADELVTEFGRTTTLVKVDRTPADPAKPWRGPDETAVDSELPVTAVMLNDKFEDVLGLMRRSPDSPVPDDILTALVAAKATGAAEVETYDALNDGGKLRKINSVDVIGPGSDRILYVIQLEK